MNKGMIIHTDCYDCQAFLDSKCGGKPGKCDDFAVAKKVDATTDASVLSSNDDPSMVTTLPANAVPRGLGKTLTAKQADFDRLTARRMETFLHQMKLFHNLVGPNYRPTPEQVHRLDAEITRAAGAFTSHALAYLGLPA
jgi:hypothetical protein